MSRPFVAKAVLAAVGLAVGAAGMALEAQELVWVAIGLLVVAFVIRLVERRAPPPAETHPSLPEADA
jgi:hypothetical protein